MPVGFQGGIGIWVSSRTWRGRVLFSLVLLFLSPSVLALSVQAWIGVASTRLPGPRSRSRPHSGILGFHLGDTLGTLGLRGGASRRLAPAFAVQLKL